jgi:hypothetical protein
MESKTIERTIDNLLKEEAGQLDLSTETPIGKAIDYILQEINLLELFAPLKGYEFDEEARVVWFHFSDDTDEEVLDQLMLKLLGTEAEVEKQPSNLDGAEWMIVVYHPQNPTPPETQGEIATSVDITGDLSVGNSNG